MKFFSALAVGLLLAGPVSAQNWSSDKEIMLLAKQGNADAQEYIGNVYSINALEASIEADDAEDAGAAASVVSAKNAEIARNFILAHVWYSLSVANGNTEAQVIRAEVALDLTPEQLEEAQSRALICLASNYQDCD